MTTVSYVNIISTGEKVIVSANSSVVCYLFMYVLEGNTNGGLVRIKIELFPPFQ